MQICEKWNSLELFAWNLFINISVSFRLNHTPAPLHSSPTPLHCLPCGQGVTAATGQNTFLSATKLIELMAQTQRLIQHTHTPSPCLRSLSLSPVSLSLPFGLPVTIKIAINSNYQRITSWKITFYYMIKVKLQLDDDNVHWNRFTCVVFPQQTANST